MAKIRKLREISTRDLLAVGLPSLLLIAAGFWVAAQFIKPAPPDRLVFTTGSDGGAYQSYAARYKEVLQRYGTELVERTSAGSIENLKRLLDESQRVDVGFIQGGTARQLGETTLESLGSIYYEPLWVFYRGKPGLTHLNELAGKRLAIGPDGSGTRHLAIELLGAHAMTKGPTRLLPLTGLKAVDALQRNEVDAVFVVGPLHSAAVWLAMHSPGVALMSFEQADAYARRYAYLSKLTLPLGSVDFVRNLPPGDIRLIAPVATVVVREDTHPALIDLLLQAMKEVHSEAGMFQRPDEFPSRHLVDFPLNKRAERFYQSGPPFLQRFLPFWVANFIDRGMVLLLPVIALLFPLMRIAPSLYSWRVRARIYRWYGELKYLELQAQNDPAARSRQEWLAEVQRIEDAVNRMPIPLAFADFAYTLRLHIDMVRQRLSHRFAPLTDGE